MFGRGIVLEQPREYNKQSGGQQRQKDDPGCDVLGHVIFDFRFTLIRTSRNPTGEAKA